MVLRNPSISVCLSLSVIVRLWSCPHTPETITCSTSRQRRQCFRWQNICKNRERAAGAEGLHTSVLGPCSGTERGDGHNLYCCTTAVCICTYVRTSHHPPARPLAGTQSSSVESREHMSSSEIVWVFSRSQIKHFFTRCEESWLFCVVSGGVVSLQA